MPEHFAIPFGTTAQGGYAFNFMSALNRNRSYAATYFLQGGFGIVFTPEDGGLMRPSSILRGGPIDFVEKIQELYGVPFGCMYAGADEYGSRARRRWESGDLKGALGDCDKSIEMDPRNPRNFRGRAHVYCMLNEFERALADWSKAIELDPDDAGTYANRALTFGKMGDFQATIVDCSKAIELNPSYARAYKLRAIAYRDSGDLESFERDCRRFMELAGGVDKP